MHRQLPDLYYVEKRRTVTYRSSDDPRNAAATQHVHHVRGAEGEHRLLSDILLVLIGDVPEAVHVRSGVPREVRGERLHRHEGEAQVTLTVVDVAHQIVEIQGFGEVLRLDGVDVVGGMHWQNNRDTDGTDGGQTRFVSTWIGRSGDTSTADSITEGSGADCQDCRFPFPLPFLPPELGARGDLLQRLPAIPDIAASLACCVCKPHRLHYEPCSAVLDGSSFAFSCQVPQLTMTPVMMKRETRWAPRK